MAAAALLRSVARKLARAPPPHPRPLLAGGGGRLHGAARSGSFPLPPPTSNQGLGMATAACFRSGAGLPSLAAKLASTPPQPHHRLVLNRGVHSRTSGSSPPPTTDKDKIIEELRRRLSSANACARLFGAMFVGSTIYMYFWLLPEIKKARYERLQLRAIKKLDYELAKKLESELNDIIAEFSTVPALSLDQIIKEAGIDMTEKRRKRPDMSEEDLYHEVACDVIRKAIADIEESGAHVKKCRANVDRILEPAPSKAHKEG